MTHYPLLFTLRDAVSGNGFLAGVTLSGRALVVRENDGKWWVYGVRPAAIAASGETPQEACYNFRNQYKTLLFDFAEEASSFGSFKGEVERFYSEPDDDEEARWVAALQAIRSQQTVVEEPLKSLPRETPENRPASISVIALHEMQRYTAADNVPDTFSLPQAA